jgi:hypothetical protein
MNGMPPQAPSTLHSDLKVTQNCAIKFHRRMVTSCQCPGFKYADLATSPPPTRHFVAHLLPAQMLVYIHIALLRELTLDLVDLQALRCELQGSIDDVRFALHARFMTRLQQTLQLGKWRSSAADAAAVLSPIWVKAALSATALGGH